MIKLCDDLRIDEPSNQYLLSCNNYRRNYGNCYQILLKYCLATPEFEYTDKEQMVVTFSWCMNTVLHMVTIKSKKAKWGICIKVDFVLREATIIQIAPNLIKTQVL